MASIGLRYFAGAKIATEPDNAAITYEAGVVLGRAVSTNLAVTNAEGELYSDDQLSEYISEFASADLTADVDNIGLENQAMMLGADYEDGELMHGGEDNAPQMGIGGVQAYRINNAQKFRTWFFAKAKASMPDWSASTRGNSFSLGTQPIKMKVTSPKFGKWFRRKEFDTFDAAKAHIDTLLSVATWYKVDVQVNGAETGEAATPVGCNAVASGGTFVLAITGTPTALYDNGVEKKSSIAAGKYTLSSMAADHKIAVIF